MLTTLHKGHTVKISAFSPWKNKENEYVPGVIAKKAELYEELQRFQDGFYSYIITQVRDIQNKDQRQKYKAQNLTAFTFGCYFKEGDYRKQANISGHTNIVYIDIDEKDIKDYIKKQKEWDSQYDIKSLRDDLFNTLPCIWSGLSCSGTGIFLLIKCEENKRADAFEDIKDYIKEKYDINIDVGCKDVGRLTFATYDPSGKIRDWYSARTWMLRLTYLDKQRKLEEYRILEKQRILVKDVKDAGDTIINRAINMIHTSRKGERHNKIRAASRLLGGYVATNAIDENYARKSIIDAVAYIDYDDMDDAIKAVDYGFKVGKQNPLELYIITPEDPQWDFFVEQDEARQKEINKLYHEIHNMIRGGLEIGKIDYEDLAVKYYIDKKRIQEICQHLYEKFKEEFGINKKPSIAKVEVYLNTKYDLRRDVVTNNLQGRINGKPDWMDMKYENIWRELQHANLKFKYEDLVRLMHSEFVPTINTWEEHFKDIEVPDDGIDYIERLASYIIMINPNEQTYFTTMFKKMLVRTIKCGLDDNYANRTVFVLASPKQSNGKSTFIRWLNPFGIHQYYAENPLEDNKDSRIRISETFIYNLEELATISKFEINRLKAIISQVGTRDRKPYSRQAENIVRRCSFFGSTNLNNFLTDDINTRWLVFDVKSINWGYTEVNKSFVWAQAYKLYKEGFNCELTEEEATYRDAKNLKYQVSMVESDLIQRYFKPAKPHESLAIFLTSTSIHERLLIYTKESKILINNVSVGRALSKLGYERSRHSNIYGYWVIPLTSVGFPTISNDGNIEESYEPPF